MRKVLVINVVLCLHNDMLFQACKCNLHYVDCDNLLGESDIMLQ